MSPQLIHSGGHTRLAGARVDECRADVWAVAERLGLPGCSLKLQGALHRSLSVLLHREVSRLTRHDPTPHPLSPELHAELGRWKAGLGPRQLEPLVEERALCWRRALIELLHRLRLDWPDLVRVFGLSFGARLTAISPPLGDFHNGGRSVYKVAFNDGSAIVYKPRPVDGEFTFGRVVEWLHENGCGPTLSFCRTLPRTWYGWTRFVEWEYCTTIAEATAYYERQGAFLALFYLLGGRDCIADNVVVAREHAVWVDLECLCGPRLPWEPPLPHLPGWVAESVLSTGMVFSPKGDGREPRRNTGLAVSCLANRSVVFAGDGSLRGPYIEAVTRGFRRLYVSILHHKAMWLSRQGPLSWWQGKQVRVIPRDTALYMALSDAFRIVPQGRRRWLRQAVEGSLRRDRSDTAWLNPMIASDTRTMQFGDVPYWTTRGHSRDWKEASGTTLRGVVSDSGLTYLYERGDRLSIHDADSQIWLIDNFLRLCTSPAYA